MSLLNEGQIYNSENKIFSLSGKGESVVILTKNIYSSNNYNEGKYRVLKEYLGILLWLEKFRKVCRMSKSYPSKRCDGKKKKPTR